MLEILISSSVLILVLAILRLALRERISARLQYALWLLVLVRLLVPVSFFHSPVSVAEAAAPVTVQAQTVSRAVVLYEWDTPALSESSGAPSQLEEENSGQVLLLRDALLLVWNLGMGVMAVWFLFVNVKLNARLRKNRKLYVTGCTPPVYVAEGIPSPCLFGLLRPAIYLTEQAASDPAQARQIVAHERTHRRHGDTLWALLRSVCLVVWWFNPLVWLAAALSRQDAELACDEGTIQALGEDARFDYGRTLVGMAKVGTRPSDLLCGATAMTTGKKSLKERVARIAQAPKTSAAVAVAVLLIAAVAVGCTYGGAAKAEPEVSPEIAVEVPASASDTDDYSSDETFSEVDPEFLAFFNEYAAAVADTVDFDTWASYLYFENDYSRKLARDTSLPFGEAAILAAEQINGDLAAFLVEYGRDPYPCLQFVGRYDGRLCIIRNKAAVPEELREGLDAMTLPDPAEGNDNIMTVDTFYWDEVDRELASFAYPADIRVFVGDGFDEAIPEDSIFGPMTLEDYIYGTDGWKFEYNSESPALEPDAQIIVYDADGRSLWIEADMNALMLHEADGSITRVTYQSDPVDCTDMIRHLLPWARGEYPTQEQLLVLEEEQQAVIDAIVDELGHYGFSDMTEYHIAGGEILHDNGVVYNLPEWAAVQQGVSGKTVYAAYGTETENIDLQYERFWRDSTNTALINAEMFESARSYYRDVLALSVSDGLQVNGHDAFAYYLAPYDIPAIMWYDTDAELIFHLTEYTVGTDPHGPSVEELISLAETVSPQ